ncbi:MAG: hypothetical protein AAB116_20385 [Candidatus Poribacteria bacterium]
MASKTGFSSEYCQTTIGPAEGAKVCIGHYHSGYHKGWVKILTWFTQGQPHPVLSYKNCMPVTYWSLFSRTPYIKIVEDLQCGQWRQPYYPDGRHFWVCNQ